MKKTMVSLAAASLIATTAMAADKGIDIVTTGQAVLYYETHQDDAKGSDDMFDQDTSEANVGLQLNLDADLKNNFTFGSQLSYLGTAGLNRNLVGDTNVKQAGGSAPLTQKWGNSDTTNDIALTQIFVAKKIANTTVKIGRQELPKSLSPFAYSEGWNVFKNTFEAVLVVNTDIPDTTLVGAAVGGGTGMDLRQMRNLTPAVNGVSGVNITGTAYMATVQNKSLPMTTITASYYNVAKIAATGLPKLEGASAVWGDVAVAGKDLPMGLKFGLQGGTIMTESSTLADTTAVGVRAGMSPIEPLSICLAYTSVDGDKNKPAIAIKNFGTGIKSPLYTQMVYNQNAIALDADTFMLKAAYNTGDYGTVTAQYGFTEGGDSNLMRGTATTKNKDYQEFDLVYSVKAAGVQYFAAYIYRTIDKDGAMNAAAGAEDDNRIRVWGRYNF